MTNKNIYNIQNALNTLFENYTTYSKYGNVVTLKISCDVEPLVATIYMDNQEWIVLDGFEDKTTVETYTQVIAMALLNELSFVKSDNFICYMLQTGDEFG